MYATVIVKRDRKKRVVYNSGKVYLRERNSVDLFLEEAEERGLEAYEIRLRPPFHEPEGEGDGYFCPYCGNWEFWVSGEDTRHCPICGMSDHDYYVKKANDLWTSGMASKKNQKRRGVMTRRNKNA